MTKRKIEASSSLESTEIENHKVSKIQENPQDTTTNPETKPLEEKVSYTQQFVKYYVDTFDQPLFRVTPQSFASFYDNNDIIGQFKDPGELSSYLGKKASICEQWHNKQINLQIKQTLWAEKSKSKGQIEKSPKNHNSPDPSVEKSF